MNGLTLTVVVALLTTSIVGALDSDHQAAIESAIMSQANEIATLKTQISDLQTSCSQSFDYLKGEIQKERMRAAFHVDFNTTTQTNMADKEVIKFDDELLDYGNGYDPNTGKYTAPVTGIYSLSVHYEEVGGQYVYVNLMTDANGKVAFSVAGDPEWQQGASFTTVVFIEKGQSAWVERETGSGTYVLNGHRSSFSGFLVRAD